MKRKSFNQVIKELDSQAPKNKSRKEKLEDVLDYIRNWCTTEYKASQKPGGGDPPVL